MAAEMTLNTTTMLYSNIPPKERAEMVDWCADVVFRGKVPNPDPVWITRWMEAHGYDERQRLLVISTALPQRILFSLLTDMTARAKAKHGQAD